MTPRLKKVYKDNVIPKLMEKGNYKNKMQVPCLKKNRSKFMCFGK